MIFMTTSQPRQARPGRHFDSLEQEVFLNLWRTYDHLVKSGSPIAMRKVSERNQIFPVFRELFARDQQPSQRAAYESQ